MDLRLFIDKLASLGELRVVEGADWDLEIGAITELSDERRGPALLFDSIKDYPPGYRVFTNIFATPRRLAITLGYPENTPGMDLVRQLKGKFKALTPIPPVPVETGPLLENIYRDKEIDLFKFPVPRWHQLDGGRYIGTADMVIMRDPLGKWVNVGTYRIQVHDRDTLGLYISPGKQGRLIRDSYWAQGKPCPVAVVFGAHPLVWMPSFLAFPWGVEEFGISGALLGEPLPLVTGEYTGLPIPAHAEIAIEGECPLPQDDSRPEGPFGEWAGYYGSGERNEPVIKVKRIMHRKNPVLTGAPPLKPPGDGAASGVSRASSLWYELERLGIPGIKGVWYLRSGGNRSLKVISIEQKYAGHAKQVAVASMSGAEGAYYARFVIVVDADIDPTNYEEVMWAVATRCDPATSIEIIPGCWTGAADPALSPEKRAKGDLSNSRALVTACRPYHWRNEFPKVNRASDKLRAAAIEKWPRLLG